MTVSEEVYEAAMAAFHGDLRGAPPWPGTALEQRFRAAIETAYEAGKKAYEQQWEPGVIDGGVYYNARVTYDDALTKLREDPNHRLKHGPFCVESKFLPWPAFDALVRSVYGAARVRVADALLREIELADGSRCPTCEGKAASLKWRRDINTTEGRCGAGHTWQTRDLTRAGRSTREIVKEWVTRINNRDEDS